MLSDICIGKYIPNDSVVYKLNPLFKLLSVIIMIISIFFINSYDDIIMLGFYLILSMIYSDIGIKVYYKNICNIKLFLIFILVVDLIFFTGIDRIIFDLFKLIFIVIYASILTYTTKMTEIVYSISKLLKPFSNIIPVNDISMVITLTLRYIPTLIEEYNRIIRAQKLRGMDFDKENLIGKINIISKMLVPMFALSIKKAEDSANIMDLRLYNYGKSRSSYRTFKWKGIDTFLFILNILILIIVIVY